MNSPTINRSTEALAWKVAKSAWNVAASRLDPKQGLPQTMFHADLPPTPPASPPAQPIVTTASPVNFGVDNIWSFTDQELKAAGPEHARYRQYAEAAAAGRKQVPRPEYELIDRKGWEIHVPGGQLLLRRSSMTQSTYKVTWGGSVMYVYVVSVRIEFQSGASWLSPADVTCSPWMLLSLCGGSTSSSTLLPSTLDHL